MHSSQLHYLPLTPAFFSLLAAALLVLVVLIQIGALHYAYTRVGLRAGAVLCVLFGSLLGSYVNIPLAELPGEQVSPGA